MDAADLRIFEAVARLGGMSRAASELNTVQSNVTARVRALEEDLGVDLFHRHSRGVSLSDAGHRLLPYARRIGRLMLDARRVVRESGAPQGTLTVGALESTAAMRLPPLLARFAAEYPGVDLVLTTGTTADLITGVREHRLEAALVAGPVQHPELDEEPVFREELVLVSARTLLRLDDVLRQPDLKLIVLAAGCSYRQRLEEVLARRGVVGLRLMEFGTLDGILGCVAAGIGITLLPRLLVEPARRDGRVLLHALTPEEAMVETVLIRPHDGVTTSALAAFRETLGPQPLSADAAE